MKVNQVIDTVMGYLEEQMVSSMTNAQEFMFYAVWESVRDETATLVERLTANPVTRVLAAIDKEGNVDTDKLIARLEKTFEKQNKVSLEVPLFGKVCFTMDDLNAIESRLKGVTTYENNS